MRSPSGHICSRKRVSQFELRTDAEFAGRERHRSERRLTEWTDVDADGPFELISDGAAIDSAPHHGRESGDVREADRQIERHDRRCACGERKTERKFPCCRSASLEHQRRPHGRKRQAKRIGIGDARPETNARAADRTIDAWTEQMYLGAAVAGLLEPRRLNDPLQLAE